MTDDLPLTLRFSQIHPETFPKDSSQTHLEKLPTLERRVFFPSHPTRTSSKADAQSRNVLQDSSQETRARLSQPREAAAQTILSLLPLPAPQSRDPMLTASRTHCLEGTPPPLPTAPCIRQMSDIHHWGSWHFPTSSDQTAVRSCWEGSGAEVPEVRLPRQGISARSLAGADRLWLARTPPSWDPTSAPRQHRWGSASQCTVGAPHLMKVLATASLSPATEVEQVGTDGTGRTPPHEWKAWGGPVSGF